MAIRRFYYVEEKPFDICDCRASMWDSSFSSQEASAFIGCSNAWQRCYEARALARLICSIAIVEPTPVGEPVCVAALAYAAAVCSYAYFWCGG